MNFDQIKLYLRTNKSVLNWIACMKSSVLIFTMLLLAAIYYAYRRLLDQERSNNAHNFYNISFITFSKTLFITVGQFLALEIALYFIPRLNCPIFSILFILRCIGVLLSLLYVTRFVLRSKDSSMDKLQDIVYGLEIFESRFDIFMVISTHILPIIFLDLYVYYTIILFLTINFAVKFIIKFFIFLYKGYIHARDSINEGVTIIVG